MSDFHAFLTQKYPLYADAEIKVNLTVKQLLELVEEFISETSPVFEVKVVEPCDHPLSMQTSYHDNSIVCQKCRCVISQFGESINPPHSLI